MPTAGTTAPASLGVAVLEAGMIPIGPAARRRDNRRTVGAVLEKTPGQRGALTEGQSPAATPAAATSKVRGSGAVLGGFESRRQGRVRL